MGNDGWMLKFIDFRSEYNTIMRHQILFVKKVIHKEYVYVTITLLVEHRLVNTEVFKSRVLL